MIRGVQTGAYIAGRDIVRAIYDTGTLRSDIAGKGIARENA